MSHRFVYGGTSFSTPIWAAIMATLNEGGRQPRRSEPTISRCRHQRISWSGRDDPRERLCPCWPRLTEHRFALSGPDRTACGLAQRFDVAGLPGTAVLAGSCGCSSRRRVAAEIDFTLRTPTGTRQRHERYPGGEIGLQSADKSPQCRNEVRWHRGLQRDGC